MASSIAAAPIFIDHQEQESSSSTSSTNSTSVTIPENEQQRKNNDNGNSERLCIILFTAILAFACLLNKILQNVSIIFFELGLEKYFHYYMVEALIILILCVLLLYAACVPRKLYIMKNVSIIFGIMFIMDLVMIVIMVNNKCYSTNENGIIETQPKFFDCKQNIFPRYFFNFDG